MEMMSKPSAQELKARLESILASRAEDLLRDTARLIQFETVSGGNPEQERKYREQIPACLKWLEEMSRANGLTFRNWDNLVAEIEWAHEPQPGEGKRPVLGIASHIDVVTPVGTWSHPPFAAEIADGVLYGRGIQDDKGPLMQAFHGMLAVKAAGIRPACDVRFIIGTMEETGSWDDIKLYLEKRPAPDCAFTPDADFPIIIGEKGQVNLKVTATWDAVKVDTETGMEFIAFRGGERSNIIPALSEVVLRFPAAARNEVMKELVRETTRYTVENTGSNVTLVPSNERELEKQGIYETVVSFIGRAAHSSTPHAGYNAINDALRFFSDIETLPPSVRAFVQFIAFLGENVDGSNYHIESNHAFLGPTTSVVTLLKIGPTGGSANINVRPTLGMPTTTVIEKAREAAAAFEDASGLAVDIQFDGKHLDAIFVDPEKPGLGAFIANLQTAFETATGTSGNPISIGGTTYAKAFPNCCAFGPVLPGVDQELAHQADERLAVSSIHRNTLIYALAIALMSSG